MLREGTEVSRGLAAPHTPPRRARGNSKKKQSTTHTARPCPSGQRVAQSRGEHTGREASRALAGAKARKKKCSKSGTSKRLRLRRTANAWRVRAPSGGHSRPRAALPLAQWWPGEQERSRGCKRRAARRAQGARTHVHAHLECVLRVWSTRPLALEKKLVAVLKTETVT